MKGLILAAIVLVTVACGSRTPASTSTPAPTTTPAAVADVWARDSIIAAMEAEGFSGSESPLNDGSQRWLGNGPNHSIVEVVGPAGGVRNISLTTIANATGGHLTGTVLGTWMPGSTQWVSDTVSGNAGADVDKTKSFGGGTVHLQTLNAVDGTIVVLTIVRG